MKKIFTLALPVLILIFSCKSEETSEELGEEIEMIYIDDDYIESEDSFSENDQENIQRLIRLTLNDLFKEDLEKGFLDSVSRRFLYDQVDLNGDGKLEILVGLTGSYFCGSGGCTVYLLTNQGDVITRFTVVDYPVYVDTQATNGWSDLVMYSGGAYRRATYNGQTYPYNPSILEEYAGDVGILPKLLEWQELEFSKF